MKNVLLIVNIVLVIAVGTLFFLYFSKTPSKIGAAAMSRPGGDSDRKDFKIAYFEMDSIENNYVYAQEIRTTFKEKERKLNVELDNIKNKWTQLYEESSQMQNNLSDDEKNKRRIALEQIEASYKNRQQVVGQELQSDAFRFKFDIHREIKEFLKKYSEENGYSYIFVNGLSEGADIMFYKDSAYDVTGDLLKALNENYLAKKKK